MYETLEELNELLNWQQNGVVHCPDRECKGMLLDHHLVYQLKCSNCGKYFDEVSELIEVKW